MKLASFCPTPIMRKGNEINGYVCLDVNLCLCFCISETIRKRTTKLMFFPEEIQAPQMKNESKMLKTASIFFSQKLIMIAAFLNP